MVQVSGNWVFYCNLFAKRCLEPSNLQKGNLAHFNCPVSDETNVDYHQGKINKAVVAS